MSLPDLPHPTVREQQYLHGLCLRMDAQNELLTQILDRLPSPPPERDDGMVELREPATPRGQEAEPVDDEGSAPESPADTPDSGRRSARRTRKTTTKKQEGTR
ncbi:hypothetical protein [Streptosporangium sp. NPDC002721]|uniref:hypothetical protein n=1 Tax=Streptosporangium sp. NPDC002721 TaxID=3366188 RepID=UPI0036977029